MKLQKITTHLAVRCMMFFGLQISSTLCFDLEKEIASTENIFESNDVMRQPWRPVQEKVHDTVVQIFAQIAETDLLQPYKAPSQYGSRGSGFFINDQGYIITNAHVVDQAVAIWIQIPSLGKRFINAELVGVCPERDIALLRVSSEDIEFLRSELGSIRFLPLGNSDAVHRSDEVLTLGYPLGQESLKSTTGVISGRERNMIQMSAPINPGSSGGPLLNVVGEVIGITSAGIIEAQNVGYIIPINDVKIVLPDLYTTPLLRKPMLGILPINGTDSLTSFLGNPHPGGCYIVEVVKDSPLYNAGVRGGDMLYAINGYRLDIYGEMRVPWSEDKISFLDFTSRVALGEDIHFAIYRKGEYKECTVKLTKTIVLPIRKIYPGYEPLDYEIFGGMVVMQLSLNHIKQLIHQAPGLAKYTEMKHQTEPVLIITHIFPNSQLFKSRTIIPGVTLNEINGIEVKTLDDFRGAVKKSVEGKYLTLKASDNLTKASDNVLVVLPFSKVLEEEKQLARDFRYPLSKIAQELLDE